MLVTRNLLNSTRALISISSLSEVTVKIYFQMSKICKYLHTLTTGWRTHVALYIVGLRLPSCKPGQGSGGNCRSTSREPQVPQPLSKTAKPFQAEGLEASQIRLNTHNIFKEIHFHWHSDTHSPWQWRKNRDSRCGLERWVNTE